MATMSQGSGASVAYLNVSGGKFRQKLSEDTVNPNAIEREITFGKNKGKMVKELEFSTVEGFITNLEIKQKEYEGNMITSLAVSLDDNVVVQFSEVQMDNVTNTLLNIDFSKKVKMSAYLKDDKNAFSFEQEGEWVKWAVTRDTPMDCPSPKQKEVKGKVKWDYSERSEWFFKKLEEIIARQFPNGRISTPEGAEYSEQNAEPVQSEETTPAKKADTKATSSEDEISVEDIPF